LKLLNARPRGRPFSKLETGLKGNTGLILKLTTREKYNIFEDPSKLIHFYLKNKETVLFSGSTIGISTGKTMSRKVR